MKTAYRLIIAILPAFLTAGCDRDMNTGVPADAQVPVEIGGATITAGVHTRAASTITSGSIGVFRTAANGYTAQYNSQYTYSVGWGPSTVVYVGGANATLCAYYPYGAVTFTPSSTQCSLIAINYNANKDLCYATTGGAAVCNKTPTASFTMTRAYARVKLSITRQASYWGNCNITKVFLKSGSGTGICVSGTLDISNGSYVTGSISALAGAINSGNMDVGATNTSFDVLVPPQPVNNGLTITLIIDGSERAVTVPAASFSRNLVAGQQYTISLSVTDVSVTLNGNINITDMAPDNTDIKNDDPIVV